MFKGKELIIFINCSYVRINKRQNIKFTYIFDQFIYQYNPNLCNVSMPIPVNVSSIDDSHSGNKDSQVLSADRPSLSAAWYSLSVWWESSSLVVDGLKRIKKLLISSQS